MYGKEPPSMPAMAGVKVLPPSVDLTNERRSDSAYTIRELVGSMATVPPSRSRTCRQPSGPAASPPTIVPRSWAPAVNTIM